MSNKVFTPENISKLKQNEVFVFGSNKAGNHVGGAARVAVEKFGAIMGHGEGLQGQSYAIPTLDEQMDKVSTEEVIGKVDDWMRNFERNMNADRSRIQRLKEKVWTPGELYMIIGMLTALRVSHDSADKRLASQVDTYPLNQGQISVFTEELLKLSLEQPRITAWDVYNVATEIYKPGKTDFPAMIPQNGAMADFLLSYNQN